MTRQEINQDVDQQLQERLDTIETNPTKHVYSKIRIIFETPDGQLLDNIGEFDYFDAPSFVLQDTVFGNSLNEVLVEKGQTCISPEIIKGFGLPDNAQVSGIILSTEAIFAMKIKTGKEKQVKGYPFLLVAGQTRTGSYKTRLLPLLVDENGCKFYDEKVGLSKQMLQVIEKVECAPAFLGKFFSDIGGRSSGFIRSGTVIFDDAPACSI